MDPNAGRRTYVSLDHIAPALVAATIATEDKDFYSHPGFDPLAILRAAWQNLESGQTVSGASTITQQLVRAVLFTPEERNQVSYGRKIREVILAAEIERRYSKDEILELYLNEIYYGKLAYGVEAASETYFNKSADQLTLGEAAFLAGLPQAPSVYDIDTNREVTMSRMEQVLTLMYTLSQERHCIYVSNRPSQPVCVDVADGTQALQEISSYSFSSSVADMRYPHWVEFIRMQLEDRYDPQTIYRSGFSVYTTLDPALQDAAQQTVTTQIAALANLHVTDGALVAIRPATGEILAMVGSPDFYNNANAGQINMAISPTRQPGSSIKLFTYLAAFEKGWTPATLLWDVPSQFPPSGKPNDTHPPYIPNDFDHKFRGPVTVRTALANSYNIPAVKALQFVGVYDDPTSPNPVSLTSMAKRMGITSLTRDDYGLSLTLGGGEVSLLDMTSGYAVVANGGLQIPPVAILKIVDFNGNVVYQYQPPAGQQVISPEHAFLMSSILSDNVARTPAYGPNSILNLPFQAAVKTGTSNDSRDNWTLGFTPDLAVGVWVGNADDTPMVNTTGVTGAGPIWSQFMMAAIQQMTGGKPTPFVKPKGVVEYTICTVSGTQPSQWCPSERTEYFASDQPPLPADQDLWRMVNVDTWTNLTSSTACSEFTKQRLAINVTDPWARQWIQQNQQGQQWARDMGFKDSFLVPTRSCNASDPHPNLQFIGLNEGQVISQTSLDISVLANASAGFKSYQLDYGLGTAPTSWTTLVNNTTTPVTTPTDIYTWNLTSLPNGPLTLRLSMSGDNNGTAERILHLNLNLPTPTPTPTPTSTPTLTPLPTLTDTPTPTPIPPSATPLPPPTNTPSPIPSNISTSTATQIPTFTSTPG
jgi:penicillin-binding protein 1C